MDDALLHLAAGLSSEQSSVLVTELPLLGPRVGPYSRFWGSGSLISPFTPKRAPWDPFYSWVALGSSLRVQ